MQQLRPALTVGLQGAPSAWPKGPRHPGTRWRVAPVVILAQWRRDPGPRLQRRQQAPRHRAGHPTAEQFLPWDSSSVPLTWLRSEGAGLDSVAAESTLYCCRASDAQFLQVQGAGKAAVLSWERRDSPARTMRRTCYRRGHPTAERLLLEFSSLQTWPAVNALPPPCRGQVLVALYQCKVCPLQICLLTHQLGAGVHTT